MKYIKTVSMVVAAALFLCSFPIFADNSSVDACAVIGADCTEGDVENVYRDFGVTRGSVKEITVTNEEERELLSDYIDSSIIGTNSISCVYLQLSETNEGIDIKINNISWCTEEMYINALTTVGISNVNVIISAPYSVSGTAALTGIYKAYETLTGKELDSTAKDAGADELTVTAELSDTIGSEDSIAIVNELKEILNETKDMSDEELRGQIIKIADEYNVSLTEDQITQLISLCRQLEKMDTTELLQRVEEAKETIRKLGEVKEDAKGFVNKIETFFKRIANFFANILS